MTQDALPNGREKRSLALHGHRTSIALEPEFWAVVDQAVVEGSVSLAGFLQKLDDDRVSHNSPLGLAGYVRVWALKEVQTKKMQTLRP